MDARRVRFPSDGGVTEGHLSLPPGGQGPGVVVIQEWWGLVPHIEDVCNRLAAEGFAALAPDLYHGRTTTSPDDAGKLMMALSIDGAERDLRGTVQYLRNHEATVTDRVGVVGFCMGGQLALFAAGRNPSIGACVDFYGVHPRVRPDYPNIRAPVLGFFGAEDEGVPPRAMREVEKALREAGVGVEFHLFPGVGHAFFNDSRPEVHDPQASQTAWTLMTAFFRKHLG